MSLRTLQWQHFPKFLDNCVYLDHFLHGPYGLFRLVLSIAAGTQKNSTILVDCRLSRPSANSKLTFTTRGSHYFREARYRYGPYCHHLYPRVGGFPFFVFQTTKNIYKKTQKMRKRNPILRYAKGLFLRVPPQTHGHLLSTHFRSQHSHAPHSHPSSVLRPLAPPTPC